MTAALSFEHVGKRYRGGTLALDDVTLAIESGARACLLGPNGAGKSTAIRLLEGALEPTAGQVRLLGAEVNGPGYVEARRRTGVVPQSPGMYADVTLAEYLDLARQLYQAAPSATDAAVEAFGLGEHVRKPLAQLSGGFQRRAVLAAALLAGPELLLLDEPTVGLDPLAAHEVHEHLKRAMAGRTTLLCTHNLAEAEALCDEVVILRGGRVLIHEPLAQLRRRARPGVRLAARQDASALLAAVAARGLDARADGEGVVVALADVEAEAPELLRALLAAGLDVYECAPVGTSLESLFLGLVQA